MQTLFDYPMSRKTDPASSHIAAANYVKSGNRETEIRKILEAFGEFKQLSISFLRVHAPNYTKRFSELRKAGYVITCHTCPRNDNHYTLDKTPEGVNG